MPFFIDVNGKYILFTIYINDIYVKIFIMKKYSALAIYNQNGLSILETLIAAGIMTIIALAFSSMLTQQQKQIKYLEAKQEIVNVKNEIFALLNKHPSTCLLGNTAVSDIPPFEAIAPPSKIEVQKFFKDPSGTKLFASVANDFENYSYFDVQSISINNLSGSGNIFTGDIIIEADISKGGIKIKPIRLNSVIFKTKSVGTTEVILSCTASLESDNKKYSFGGIYSTGPGVVPQSNPLTGAKNCPAGFNSARIYFDSFAQWDNLDAEIFLCLGDPKITSGYNFGGVYSTSGACGNKNNPFTGNTSCPPGFTSSLIYYDDFSCWDNNDAAVYLCHSGPSDYPLNGFYSTGIDMDNPYTGYRGCPPGSTESEVYFDSFSYWDNGDSRLILCH